MKISPLALAAPDIDTSHGIMHTLFALEGTFGLEIKNINGEVSIKFSDHDLSASLRNWKEKIITYNRIGANL